MSEDRCQFLIARDGKNYCKLATELARTDCEVEHPSICETCKKAVNPQSPESSVVQSLAKRSSSSYESEQLLAARERLGPGVGTEVHKMIPKFLEQPGCKCKDMARKMNLWGVEGCERNRKTIVDHLVKKAHEVGFFSWIPKSGIRMVADRMLSSAIARVKAQQQTNTNKWFCAVATAPRKISTLSTCLESMELAGWEPYVFAEPGSEQPPARFRDNTINHAERKGVWHNWLYSLRYALDNSDANVIMTVQDDSLFHPDSKLFAERILWPSPHTGFVSLYTPKHYSIVPKFKTKQRPFGINRVHTRSLWGSCALIWPRQVVETIVDHPFCEEWYGAPTKTKEHWERIKKQRMEEPWRIQNSDTAQGKLMNRLKKEMWFVDPSPVQHISLTSATGHGGNKGRRNCGRCANWSEDLFSQVPLEFNGEEPTIYKHEDLVKDSTVE